MNEQLIVKNFGPIKDATVDFKRVTVFIGPTGGGKSTLAKLAAIFRDDDFFLRLSASERQLLFNSKLSLYGLSNFGNSTTEILLDSMWNAGSLIGAQFTLDESKRKEFEADALPKLQALSLAYGVPRPEADSAFNRNFLRSITNIPNETEARRDYFNLIGQYFPDQHYVPADRVLAAFVTGSTFRLQSQKVGTSSILIDFLGSLEMARDFFAENGGCTITIPSLELHYDYQENKQTVRLDTPHGVVTTLLSESASGVQSVVPLALIADFFGELTAHSFIIEEPELNLYPTAQRGLVYWLLEKCTQGENELTITTHSPYVLSALNLALYAHKVAELFPYQRQKVARIIPAKYWLKADDFSAYHVAGGNVKSIFDRKTGLLSESQLDEVSGHFADVFDRLTDLRVPEKKAPAKAKTAKK